MPAPALIRESFTDCDEFCAAAVGMDIEIGQLDRGKLAARLKLAVAQNFVVQHFDLGRRFHQRGAVSEGLLTFGLPDYVDKLTWYGRTMERDSILNFSRREGFDAVSDDDFTGYTFSITTDGFDNAVSALDDSLSAKQVPDMADHFAADDADIRRIRMLAYGVHQCLENRTAGMNVYLTLEADITHLLARRVCNSSATDVKSSIAGRQLAVNKALELILSTQSAIQVSDVYRYSCVSWRTLDRAFKERFGVTPKQYIVATRMLGVRRALVAGTTDSKITDVANDWGFWHLGRFSSDYKHMFGELPSQTLQRSSSREPCR